MVTVPNGGSYISIWSGIKGKLVDIERTILYLFFFNKEKWSQFFWLTANKEQFNPSFLCRAITAETTMLVCNYVVYLPYIWKVFGFFFFLCYWRKKICANWNEMPEEKLAWKCENVSVTETHRSVYGGC